ncbi:MAG: (Fe-S)-binding protein [Rikenellaceae bacterium]
MSFFAPFTIPFIIGVVILFAVVAAKYASWILQLRGADKRLVLRNIISLKSIKAIGEIISESLLHRRIFKVNPLLGYMHMSLAFGWFLLIATGWAETIHTLGFEFIPPQGHVFFRYFASRMGLPESHTFAFLMDLWLAVVLSGVCLAWFKRLYSKALGLKRTTQHKLGDRIAMSVLWLIFPARLVAESLTCAIYGGGSFLTGSIGEFIASALNPQAIYPLYNTAWWIYSIALCLFFGALPFSRYMHIFTEIPLIFMRHWGLKAKSKETSYDNFEVEACSRCGICIDPCQLQSVLGIEDVQSSYFLRDRRYKMLDLARTNNCLMCGRCQSVCPVGINLNTLRLNSRHSLRNTPNERRFDYIKPLDNSSGSGKVGYFAGCMTLLTPSTLHSMERIFKAAGESVWWADREGGVCCGRPLHLSGEVDSARKMMDHNRELFIKHNITTLVTSCPICLKVFLEEYNLQGIEVIHHSQYIDRLIRSKRISVEQSRTIVTYHDPCELGRGCGIYDEPRRVINSCAELHEAPHARQNSLCCGSSLANTTINDAQQVQIATALTKELDSTQAQTIITSCPLCKKALVRTTTTPIRDISEVVASALK